MGSDGNTYKRSPREDGVSVYQSEDAVKDFIDELLEIKQDFQEKLRTVAPMKLTDQEEQAFKEAKFVGKHWVKNVYVTIVTFLQNLELLHTHFVI